MKFLSLSIVFVVLLQPLLADGADARIETAPAIFQVQLDTSFGPVVIEVTRANAPVGADRFYSLVRSNFYDGCRFFRVIPGTIVQFGMPADPALNKVWKIPFPDDPRHAVASNRWATVSFARSYKPNSRTTQLFINLDDNHDLDSQGFVPIGRVISGMRNISKVYSGYGDAPDQNQIEAHGNAYLEKDYPKLDFIKSARVLP